VATQLETRQELRLVHRQQTLDRFQLENQFSFDDKVQTEAQSNRRVL